MSSVKVNGEALARLLRRVFLNGIVDECVLEVDEDCRVQAMDMTGMLFLSCVEEIELGLEIKWGLGNLALLCRFLDSAAEETIELEVSEERILLRREEHGELAFLLSEPDVVPTVVEDKNAINELSEQCRYGVALKEDVQQDFLFYMSLLKIKSVDLSVDSDGEVVVSGGLESEHQFSLDVGKARLLKSGKYVKPKKAFEVTVFGEHLASVLQVLEWGDDKSPVIHFADGKPVIVKQDDDNLWVLAPLSDKE
jgi:hypothetical protein